jgi:hypothetical protein
MPLPRLPRVRLPLGVVGVALIAAGVYLLFGLAIALIVVGVALVVDELTEAR